MRPLFAGRRSSLGRGLLTRPQCPSGARAAPVTSRPCVVAASSRLVLTPTGDGSCDHIGAKVAKPGAIPLKDGVYEVGRSSPADILLPIPTVSTRHALLRVENDSMFVTDLNSTNGTTVNGQELSPMDNVEVEVGAEITFGDVYLARFQLDLVPDAGGVSTPDAADGPGPVVAMDSGTLVLGDGDGDSEGAPRPATRVQKRAAQRKPYSPY